MVYQTSWMRIDKRLQIPGGCYFFTVNLAERENNNKLIRHIENLRDAFRQIRNNHPFNIDAIVILPEHLHCIWQLPADNSDYPTRWRLIKAKFSISIAAGERISASRKQKSERGIWQCHYWGYCLRDERDYPNHLDYIHYHISPMRQEWHTS